MAKIKGLDDECGHFDLTNRDVYQLVCQSCNEAYLLDINEGESFHLHVDHETNEAFCLECAGDLK